jgi:hypothetical protein
MLLLKLTHNVTVWPHRVLCYEKFICQLFVVKCENYSERENTRKSLGRIMLSSYSLLLEEIKCFLYSVRFIVIGNLLLYL